MNRFRYDVLLHVDHCADKTIPVLAVQPWDYQAGDSLEDQLKHRCGDLWVRGYPNKRVWGDSQILQGKAQHTANDLLEIEALYSLAALHNCQLNILLDSEDVHGTYYHLYFSDHQITVGNAALRSKTQSPVVTYSNTPYSVKESLSAKTLQTFMSEQLPSYMVPSQFVCLDSLPLTLNGKVDRQALPDPQWINSDTYIAPRNDLEVQLCAIWQEVLGIDQVGIHDNFFRIGGDSIISIQLVSRLRRAGFQLQLKSIFEAPSIAQMVVILGQSQADMMIVAEQGSLTGAFDLLPIQQWFFDQQWADPYHWNQAFMLHIPETVTSTEINHALLILSQHHNSLRCRFEKTKSRYQQCYAKTTIKLMAPLKVLDVNQYDNESLLTLLSNHQRKFNYRKGPLWQAVHLTGYPDGSARLFFAFHHLIIDVVSWRIIAEGMQTLLTKQSLLEKTSSYRQWTQAVQQYAEAHTEEISYWTNVLSEPMVLPVPQRQILTTQVRLSSTKTAQLLQQANGCGLNLM